MILIQIYKYKNIIYLQLFMHINWKDFSNFLKFLAKLKLIIFLKYLV